MKGSREMTLRECVDTLHEGHRARREFVELSADKERLAAQNDRLYSDLIEAQKEIERMDRELEVLK